jgi:hypothetical protein
LKFFSPAQRADPATRRLQNLETNLLGRIHAVSDLTPRCQDAMLIPRNLIRAGFPLRSPNRDAQAGPQPFQNPCVLAPWRLGVKILPHGYGLAMRSQENKSMPVGIAWNRSLPSNPARPNSSQSRSIKVTGLHCPQKVEPLNSFCRPDGAVRSCRWKNLVLPPSNFERHGRLSNPSW